jgi:hypothetical protein
MTNVSPTAMIRNQALSWPISEKLVSDRNLPGDRTVKKTISTIRASSVQVSLAVTRRRPIPPSACRLSLSGFRVPLSLATVTVRPRTRC